MLYVNFAAVTSTYDIIIMQFHTFRSSSGFECYSYGYDTFITYCLTRTICHYNLRNHWSRTIFWPSSQDMLE